MLTITDFHSRFSILEPLEKTRGIDVVKVFEQRWLRGFPTPKIINIDNGPQYTSREFVRFCDQK